MTVPQAESGVECIHGLDIAMCDVCSPRQAPEPPRRAAVRRQAPPRTGRASTTPSTAPGVRVDAAQRVYAVVAIDRLPEALDRLADQEWRTELGSATDPFRWPDAADAQRPGDVVVLVATAADGALQLVAAANEPARRTVRERLGDAAADTRVVLQPAWWA